MGDVTVPSRVIQIGEGVWEGPSGIIQAKLPSRHSQSRHINEFNSGQAIRTHKSLDISKLYNKPHSFFTLLSPLFTP